MIIGVSDASSIFIGQILSPVMWFGHVRDNCSCQILSINGASCFGHLCRADTGQDHSRALHACIRGPPKDWRRRTGRPRQTWLRTVEDDLRPLNFGLASGDGKTAHYGYTGMASTRGCGFVLVTRPRERERERECKS